MEHSEMYKSIRDWSQIYHLWKKQHVHAAVPELITAEEYEEITGEPYVPDPEQEATISDYEDALEELGVKIDEEE